MLLWGWALLLVYLSLLFFAALWAAVERTRSAWKRRREPVHAVPLEQYEPERVAAPADTRPQPRGARGAHPARPHPRRGRRRARR